MHRSGTAMAWNVFKFCTALRGLGSVMILLVLGIVGVTYYALVLCNYGPVLLAATGALDALVALVVLVLFHFLVHPRPLALPFPLFLVILGVIQWLWHSIAGSLGGGVGSFTFISRCNLMCFA